jgi:hypothetical protein
MSEIMRVTLIYQHPDNQQVTTYEQHLAPDAAGLIPLLMDALADRTDPEYIHNVSQSIATALAGV